MKGIMFNDRFGLTEAVLEGRKTMTRRIVPIGLYNQTDWKAVTDGDYKAVVDGEEYYHDIRDCGQYRVDEVVAIVQAYKDIYPNADFKMVGDKFMTESPGWKNKMFTRPSLMPHHIKITDIRVEPLRSISDEDCLREGIMEGEFTNTWDRYYFDTVGDVHNHHTFKTPRAAFAALIDKVGKKGTWASNPWVFCYSFELVD